MSNQEKVRIHYFTDVLCVWAYLAQIRLDEVIKNHNKEIEMVYNFMPTFGNTANRIGQGWKDKGGFDGFSAHTHEVCEAYPHIELHKDIWKKNAPVTSSTSHLLIKAAQTLIANGSIENRKDSNFTQQSLIEELIWRVRIAFFRDLKDISQMSVLMDIADELKLPINKLETAINDGSALAAFSRDIELKDEFGIEGSPTYVLNEGRQKLYGNVGYRIIDANIQEVLNKPQAEASWC